VRGSYILGTSKPLRLVDGQPFEPTFAGEVPSRRRNDIDAPNGWIFKLLRGAGSD
jgi:hypothetical protein